MRSLVCKLFGHKVDRRRVWNDSVDFRTSCARCDRSMLRDLIGWREYDAHRDGDLNRMRHPRHEEG